MLKPDWFDKWFDETFPDKKVFSALEIAEILKKHPETVYRALRYGFLEGIRVGRRSYVIPRDAVKKWLLECNVLNIES